MIYTAIKELINIIGTLLNKKPVIPISPTALHPAANTLFPYHSVTQTVQLCAGSFHSQQKRILTASSLTPRAHSNFGVPSGRLPAKSAAGIS